MSDVTPDVEALAEVLSHSLGERERTWEPWAAETSLDWIETTLRADSPAGDALRERLGLRWELDQVLTPIKERPGMFRYVDNERRLLADWEPTP